jgi:NAD(P)-dependent dehydrogenase (short-subunit alcohol dehydrogenase family)
VQLDIAHEEQVRAPAARVGRLDILINNAGVFLFDDLSDRRAFEQHRSVNLLGTYGVIQAFVPERRVPAGAARRVLAVTGKGPLALNQATLPLLPPTALSQHLRQL